jgi:hypothetical protein
MNSSGEVIRDSEVGKDDARSISYACIPMHPIKLALCADRDDRFDQEHTHTYTIIGFADGRAPISCNQIEDVRRDRPRSGSACLSSASRVVDASAASYIHMCFGKPVNENERRRRRRRQIQASPPMQEEIDRLGNLGDDANACMTKLTGTRMTGDGRTDGWMRSDGWLPTGNVYM